MMKPAGVARSAKLERLVELIHSLEITPTASWKRASEGTDHMGAVLADAVLQSGVNYKIFVQPRVRRIRTVYPEASTIGGFRRLIRTVGPRAVLDVANITKCTALWGLVDLFGEEHVDTVADLRAWIDLPSSRDKLLAVHGVGQKTAAFLRMLLGHDGIAIDTHIRRAAKDIDVVMKTDEELVALFADAALQAGHRLIDIDGALWTRESGRKRRNMA